MINANIKRLLISLIQTGGCLATCALVPVFIVFLIVLLNGLDERSRGSALFYIEEDPEYGNGRNLVTNYEGNDYWEKNGIGRLDSTCLWPTHKRLMDMPSNQPETDEIDSFFTPQRCPIYIHRFSGQVDTFYCYKAVIDIGYIQRYAKTEEWMIMECKSPRQILGSSYEETRSTSGTKGCLDCYTWEGQRLVFESPESYFWIAGKKSPHLYGPLSISQLPILLKRLGMVLPITLKGKYDRYVHNHADYKGWQDDMPHEFYWPHHKSRPDRIIQ